MELRCGHDGYAHRAGVLDNDGDRDGKDVAVDDTGASESEVEEKEDNKSDEDDNKDGDDNGTRSAGDDIRMSDRNATHAALPSHSILWCSPEVATSYGGSEI